MQHRVQALAMKGTDYLLGMPCPSRPRFRLLQSNQMLKAMLVRCHEVGKQFAYTLYQSAIVAVTHLSLGDVQSAIQLHACNFTV